MNPLQHPMSQPEGPMNHPPFLSTHFDFLSFMRVVMMTAWVIWGAWAIWFLGYVFSPPSTSFEKIVGIVFFCVWAKYPFYKGSVSKKIHWNF